MGMYNELNNIKRAVDQQAIEMKRTQEHQKQVEYIKSELKSMLHDELIESNNIYSEEIKEIAIENVVNNTLMLLYSKDYTRQFLNEKYYTVARQVEQIKKKTETAPNDYKKQIALEKWGIQKQREQIRLQREQIRLQKEAEQLKKLQQPQQKQQKADGLQVLGIVLTVLCLPVGLLILCILSAASKQK